MDFLKIKSEKNQVEKHTTEPQYKFQNSRSGRRFYPSGIKTKRVIGQASPLDIRKKTQGVKNSKLKGKTQNSR